MVRVERRHRCEPVLDQPLGGGPRPARAMTTAQKVLLGLGTLSLGILVWQIDMNVVRAALLQVGWGLALVLGQEAIAHLLNALGWRFAFAREDAGAAVGDRWRPLERGPRRLPRVAPVGGPDLGGVAARVRSARGGIRPWPSGSRRAVHADVHARLCVGRLRGLLDLSLPPDSRA